MLQLPRVQDLIPHRNTMLFVDQFLSYDAPGVGSVKLKIKKNALYMENEVFQNEWCIEIMSQAVGCVFSYDIKYKNNDLALGFLISIDQFTLNKSSNDMIQVGDDLVVEAKLECDLFPVRKYNANIIHKNKNYASASMKFYAQNRNEIKINEKKSINNWW